MEGSSRRLFYFALPSTVYPQVCKMIKNYSMNRSDHGGWTHIIVEKPFGKDLAAAEELSSQIGELFEGPRSIVLIIIWERNWCRTCWCFVLRTTYFCLFGIVTTLPMFRLYSEKISEPMAVVLCLVSMEKPISLNPEHIRDEKVKVLQSVIPIKEEEVVLGQYEDNSNTPTFARVILRIYNERWEGVPSILKAGKPLNSRKAEICVQFKDVPGDIFKCQKHGRNEFVIRLQPSEAMYMKLS